MARMKLLCILAHPDDESLGLGGILFFGDDAISHIHASAGDGRAAVGLRTEFGLPDRVLLRVELAGMFLSLRLTMLRSLVPPNMVWSLGPGLASAASAVPAE